MAMLRGVVNIVWFHNAEPSFVNGCIILFILKQVEWPVLSEIVEKSGKLPLSPQQNQNPNLVQTFFF